MPKKIVIPETEQWDEVNECFIHVKEQTIVLEHSLVSISKWESKWNKPFLGKTNKTQEELLDYIRCMTITPNVDSAAYYALTNEIIEEIRDYIDAPMTATWFSEDKNPRSVSREVITSELIYYWMVALQIPFECEKWHINRLLTLIRICNIKNQPPKKMGKRATMSKNAKLNAARRARLGSKG